MKEEHIKDVLKLWQSTDGIYLHQNGEDSEEGIKLYLKRNPGLSFITTNEKKQIIGALLCGHDGRRGLIHHLAVNKEYRHKGIAKKLIDLALDGLRKIKIKKVALFVLKDRLEAQEFYNHNNWMKEDIVFVYSKMI